MNRTHAVRPGGGKGAAEFDSIDREDKLIETNKSRESYPDVGPPSRRQLAKEHAKLNAPGQCEARKSRTRKITVKSAGTKNEKVSPIAPPSNGNCDTCGRSLTEALSDSKQHDRCVVCIGESRLAAKRDQKKFSCCLS